MVITAKCKCTNLPMKMKQMMVRQEEGFVLIITFYCSLCGATIEVRKEGMI